MKPKTKSELMAEWANQPDQLKKEREVKAVRKAMDDARAAIQDGLTRYVMNMRTCYLNTTNSAGKLKNNVSSWLQRG